MADEKVNISLNVNNQIKQAEQKNAQARKSSDSKKSDMQTITPQLNIQSSKFIQELTKSNLFKNINSSINKVSENIQDLSSTTKSVLELKNSLANIQKALKSSETNQQIFLKNLPEQFAKNSFFKELFDNLNNINLLLKTNYLNQTKASQTETTNSTDIASELDPFFSNINTNLETFSQKFDSLIQVVQNLNLENIISKDDLVSVLSDYKFNISDETVEKINQNLNNQISESNTEIIQKISQLNQFISQNFIQQSNNELITQIYNNISNINTILDERLNLNEVTNKETQQLSASTQEMVNTIDLNINQQKAQTAEQVSNTLSNIAISIDSNINNNNEQQKENNNSQFAESLFNIKDDLISNLTDIVSDYSNNNNINVNLDLSNNINNQLSNNMNNEEQTNIDQNINGLTPPLLQEQLQTSYQEPLLDTFEQDRHLYQQEPLMSQTYESPVQFVEEQQPEKLQSMQVQSAIPQEKLVKKQESLSKPTENSQIKISQSSNNKADLSKSNVEKSEKSQVQNQSKTISFDIASQVQDVYDNLQEKIQIDEDVPFECNLLTDQNQIEAFQNLLNSNKLQDIKKAIQIAQLQLNKLIKLSNDTKYSKYSKRISIYISSIQQLLQIAQKKLKSVTEVNNNKLAQEQLKNIKTVNNQNKPQKKSVIKSFADDIFKSLDNLFKEQQQLKGQTKVNLPTNKQNESQKIQNIKLDSTDLSKTQQKQNTNTIITSIIEKIDFKDKDINAYGKQYIYNVIKAQAQKIQQTSKTNVSPELLQVISNAALQQFNQALKLNKILIYDTENNKKVLYAKDQLIKSSTLTSYENVLTQVPRQNNNSKSQQTTTVVQNSFNTESKTQQKKEFPKVSFISQSVNQSANKKLSENIAKVTQKNQKNNENQDTTDFSTDSSVYDFSPKTKSESYNNYVLDKKYNYIVNKHILAEKNNEDIDDNFDKINSDTWNKQYQNGSILSMQSSKQKDSSTPFESTSQSVNSVKKKFNVKQNRAETFAIDTFKQLDDLFKEYDELKKDTNKSTSNTNSQNNSSNLLQKGISKVTEVVKTKLPEKASTLTKPIQSAAKDGMHNLISDAKTATVQKLQAPISAMSKSGSQISNSISQASNALLPQQPITQNLGQDTSLNSSAPDKSINLLSIQNSLKDLVEISKNHVVQPVYIPMQPDGIKTTILNNNK